MPSPTPPRSALIAHAGSAFFVDLIRSATRSFEDPVEVVAKMQAVDEQLDAASLVTAEDEAK